LGGGVVWHCWQLCSSGHPYHTDGLTCLALSSDSTLAITGSKDNSVHIVNITTGRVCFLLALHNVVVYFSYCSQFWLDNLVVTYLTVYLCRQCLWFFDMLCIGMLLLSLFSGSLLRYLESLLRYSGRNDRKHNLQ
jgi:WD40 repeat protein